MVRVYWGEIWRYLWDLRTLGLIKKEHLWHFETKEGRGIDALGTWDTVRVVAVNRSKVDSRITFQQDTVNYQNRVNSAQI